MHFEIDFAPMQPLQCARPAYRSSQGIKDSQTKAQAQREPQMQAHAVLYLPCCSIFHGSNGHNHVVTLKTVSRWRVSSYRIAAHDDEDFV